MRVEQFEVEERLRLIGIDNGEYKAVDTQDGLAGEPVRLRRAHFASEGDGTNQSNDDERDGYESNGQARETQANGGGGGE